MTCKWNGTGQPRTLANRHDDDCQDEGCRGCAPCTERHCRVCGVAHSDGACPGCLDEARANLTEIGRMTGDLPAEVEARGIEGEAFVLLGPSADPEARGHLEASVLAGRVPKEYLDEVRGDLHPTFVAERWGSVYREAFDHDEPLGRVHLGDELGYLGRNLTYMAGYEWVPFEDFATDLRRCVAHLEAVLHDGQQVERTRVTCTNEHCGRRPMLERQYGTSDRDDRWRCPSCRKTYDPGEYRDAHARQLVHKGAEKYLPLRDAVSTLVAQGRPERTIRKWLAPPDPERDDLEGVVGGFCEIDSHRVWVWWPDLWRLHMTTKTRNRVGAAA